MSSNLTDRASRGKRTSLSRRNKGEERALAAQRIERLVALASECVAQRPERAHRYAELAWRLKTRYQLGRCALDGRICRACHAFWTPGVSLRVRVQGGKLVRTCLRCGAHRRMPLAPRPPAAAPAPQP